MEEIFNNISKEFKARTEFIFQMAMRQKYIGQIANVLNQYCATCINEEERAFAEFYFNMKLEQLKGQ